MLTTLCAIEVDSRRSTNPTKSDPFSCITVALTTKRNTQHFFEFGYTGPNGGQRGCKPPWGIKPTDSRGTIV